MSLSNFKLCFVAVSLLLSSIALNAQSKKIVLKWNDLSNTEKLADKKIEEHFENAQYDFSKSSLPTFVDFISVSSTVKEADIRIENPIFKTVDKNVFNQNDLKNIQSQINIESHVVTSRKKKSIAYSFTPIIMSKQGEYQILVSADVRVASGSIVEVYKKAQPGISFNTNSKLNQGDWYKISITQDGIYRLDYQFLSALGIDVANLNPNDFNIYGAGGSMLPFDNSEFRHDDLPLNAIKIIGGDDGSFDQSDYAIFYGKGPQDWVANSDNETFSSRKHLFSNKAYYYIGIGQDAPKRVEMEVDIVVAEDHVVTTFNAFGVHDIDATNLNLSGREFYGEHFDFQTSYTFSGSEFEFDNIDVNSPVYVEARVINITGNPNQGEWTLECNGNSAEAIVSGVSTSSQLPARGTPKTFSIAPFIPTSDELPVTVSFQKDISSEEGYLDYVTINARRNLVMSGSQLNFRDLESVGNDNISRFILSDAGSVYDIWDVTDPVNVKSVDPQGDGNTREFVSETSQLKTFMAFRNSGYLTPVDEGIVENQDLHGMTQQDMIILSVPMFLDQANDLADFHREEGLLVEVVTPMQVYNEFSSGNPDITAIKMFCKMFYDRSNGETDMLDYLLLMGDATYINNQIDPEESPYIVSYQSQQSLSQTLSYIADDYFGFLDDSEGDSGSDQIDVGIGRFTATTVEEVEAIINKIKVYSGRSENSVINSDCFSNDNSVYGDWRTKIIMVSDDEDTVTHIDDADDTSDIVEDDHPEYNIQKIYIDAYQQEIALGGERYPEVELELNESIEQGALLVSYFGHGGEVGWAHERILDLSMINGFTNLNQLPVFFTATCEFSRMDDPDRISAGEYLLLNPNGGAAALISTTRPVYASSNQQLASAFYNIVFKKDDNIVSYGSSGDNYINHGLRLGDLTRISKNGISSGSINKRNFSLLGDPALKLAYPEMVVEQDQILDEEGNPITNIQALQKVTIVGHVEDASGNLLSDFNGFISPTVYDKAKTINTLQNDPGSGAYTFNSQNNILYKGNASVTNGQFSYTFIVPKDISYQDGNGRISYYALSDQYDAIGYNEKDGVEQAFTISGQNEDAPEDNIGPDVELFLDSESFVDGSITSEEPLLIAKLRDENGINTSNNAVGHDITLVVDDNSLNTILLNDQYRADLDTYQSGRIEYRLPALEAGQHTLTLKVWDIYNNSSTKTITFEVATSNNLVLENVINYPNPFTTHTEFMFQHNQGCSTLDVDVQIFTVSGKLVKTISKTVVSDHDSNDQKIAWNGLDDYGDKLGRGVYLYKLKVKTSSGLKEEVFEKLVILN